MTNAKYYRQLAGDQFKGGQTVKDPNDDSATDDSHDKTDEPQMTEPAKPKE